MLNLECSVRQEKWIDHSIDITLFIMLESVMAALLIMSFLGFFVGIKQNNFNTLILSGTSMLLLGAFFYKTIKIVKTQNSPYLSIK